MSFGSKTPSSILEVLDQNQAAGSSIQRTISEALASISEGDQRTRFELRIFPYRHLISLPGPALQQKWRKNYQQTIPVNLKRKAL